MRFLLACASLAASVLLAALAPRAHADPPASLTGRWIATVDKLTPSEVAQVLGTVAEYRLSEVADRNAGIVLELATDRLRPLTPAR